MPLMTRNEFCAKNTEAGQASELKKAFKEKTPAAFFVDERSMVYYSIKDKTSAYDPIWALFGTGDRPKKIYCNYTKHSESEKGILKVLGEKIKFQQTDEAGTASLIERKTIKRVTMNVGTDLADLYKIPTDLKDVVSDIQSDNASVKNDNGEYTTAGNRTVHRVYMMAAFTLLDKLQEGRRDGVVALVVDRKGRIISWGRKNPSVPCWHGETSALMRLGGTLPDGCCVFSTLKPCNMCAGLIYQASEGKVKVFWGQNDPGLAAEQTVLETEKKGYLLDGNKSHLGVRAILLGVKPKPEESDKRPVMATKLATQFESQKETGEKSTISYIMKPEARKFVKDAEVELKKKYEKYQNTKPDGKVNANTRSVTLYLIKWLEQLGVSATDLGT
jgi:tRNA(Arg) A34 adenosine deaminase TadA